MATAAPAPMSFNIPGVANSNAWAMACALVVSGQTDIFLPGVFADYVGDAGLNNLVDMMTHHLGGFPCAVEYLAHFDLWRLYAVTNPAAPARPPPRPMNCFILYRDTEYKRLKSLCPELSVQSISKMVSEAWRAGGAELHREWKDKADLAKAEHQRLYPGYKYTPRKPGQKKKRQSRKRVDVQGSADDIPGSVQSPLPSGPAIDFNKPVESANGTHVRDAESHRGDELTNNVVFNNLIN